MKCSPKNLLAQKHSQWEERNVTKSLNASKKHPRTEVSRAPMVQLEQGKPCPPIPWIHLRQQRSGRCVWVEAMPLITVGLLLSQLLQKGSDLCFRTTCSSGQPKSRRHVAEPNEKVSCPSHTVREICKVNEYLTMRRNFWTTYTDQNQNLLKIVINLTTNIVIYESATRVCLENG